MRIEIKEGGKKPKKFKILLPSALVLNRFTAGIIVNEATKHGTSLTKEQVMKIIKNVKAYKKHNKDWVLADIESADGSKVLVKL